LSHVLMHIQVDPRSGFPFEQASNGSILGEYLTLEGLGSESLFRIMIVDNIDDPHSAFENLMNLPAVLDLVANLPLGSHMKLGMLAVTAAGKQLLTNSLDILGSSYVSQVVCLLIGNHSLSQAAERFQSQASTEERI
jgi:hypothetical protein